MRGLVWGVGGFLAGGVLAGVVGLSLPEIMPISQAEGAYAMGVVFFWVPLGAVAGAVAGVVCALRRR